MEDAWRMKQGVMERNKGSMEGGMAVERELGTYGEKVCSASSRHFIAQYIASASTLLASPPPQTHWIVS